MGTNVEEMGHFDGNYIRAGIARLVRRYNERICACGADRSLMVVEPEWMTEIVGEWNGGNATYTIVVGRGVGRAEG